METATITLNRNDLGQVIDGLTQRMESYARTAEFLDNENHNLDEFLIEEVRDSAEARTLARNYERIIENISQQLVEKLEPRHQIVSYRRGQMSARPVNDGTPWTRDQLILAFELYCRIPFGRITTRNPLVRDLAATLGRTPASVARKLGNFGAFDPELAARNVSGLTHSSKLDRIIWDEFHSDWNGLVLHAHEIRSALDPQKIVQPVFAAPKGPSERIATVKQRLHQSFFRDAVLSSYNARCCVTGLPIVECLVAGHIIPWSVDEARRSDPTNGLCLSATFDCLFDSGLMTFSDDLILHLSPRIDSHNDQAVVEQLALRHGQKMIPPSRFHPDPNCIRWHRENIFQSTRQR